MKKVIIFAVDKQGKVRCVSVGRFLRPLTNIEFYINHYISSQNSHEHY